MVKKRRMNRGLKTVKFVSHSHSNLSNGDVFLATVLYVLSEWVISWYLCNPQVISFRLIYNLSKLNAFIWVRYETALARKEYVDNDV